MRGNQKPACEIKKIKSGGITGIIRLFVRLSLQVAGICLLLTNPVMAQESTALNGGNTAWILTSTALVLFMTLPGLALFYSGLVQSKNVLSVLMHCFAIACLVSVLWLAFAYSIAFGDGGAANISGYSLAAS